MDCKGPGRSSKMLANPAGRFGNRETTGNCPGPADAHVVIDWIDVIKPTIDAGLRSLRPACERGVPPAA